MHAAGFNYIGGLGGYWVNKIVPHYGWNDYCFVDPSYFERRRIPIPSVVHTEPPIGLKETDPGWAHWSAGEGATWNSGYTRDEEINKVIQYIKKSKEAASATERTPRAHRTEASNLVYQKNFQYGPDESAYQ